MFRLERRTSVFSRAWFLTLAVATSFFLGAGMMKLTAVQAGDGVPGTLTCGEEMVMIVTPRPTNP